MIRKGWIGQWPRLLACQLRYAAAAARPGAPRCFRSARRHADNLDH